MNACNDTCKPALWTMWHCIWEPSMNCWCEGQPGSHWQEGNTQALTCKRGISTQGVTFSMKSRHLAQGILESLAQTDSSGSVYVCVKERVYAAGSHSSFLRSFRKTTLKPNSATLGARMSWPREHLSGCPLMSQRQCGSGWCTGVSGTP